MVAGVQGGEGAGGQAAEQQMGLESKGTTPVYWWGWPGQP